MDSKYQPQLVEEKIYRDWEEKGYFKAKVNPNKKPFSIILPPPNANANLHLGHAMYVYEDIMIRYKKLTGFETLWLPGADHAGFETQFVFEKHLAKQDKSRFDYDRETLYKMIWDFVQNNRSNMENQLRRLGFALDWSRRKFTLDDDIIKVVYGTFKQMFDDGLVYRGNRLVNYCTYCGTSFSDLEVVDLEKEGLLYYVNFSIKQGGFIQIATTRPETILGDVAVMVNPKDKRYKGLIGQTVILPITNREVPIIGDSYVDMKFGTGAVKVTPNHDFNDFEIAKKHNLSYPPIISFAGRIQNANKDYDGLKVKVAREKIIQDLKNLGLFVKEEKHQMVLKTCYKCNRVLEPLPKEQWYVKIRPLADNVIRAIKEKKVTFLTKRFEKIAIQWLKNFYDWNISRQVVWGIRIPAWKCEECNSWVATNGEIPKECNKCKSTNLKQDEDVFDTWFSSAQWPFATLQGVEKGDFEYFYPTSVMETGYDILPQWVCRMLMVGLYRTNKVPFKNVFLHGMVRDRKGQKMSKSKGNVINPLELVDKFGADALRSALIFGTKEGGDVSLSEEKVIGMRNFINKIWNMGRFISMNRQVPSSKLQETNKSKNSKILNELQKEYKKEKKQYLKYMDSYQFSKALGLVYEFIWHRFADYYIEQLKDEVINGNIEARQGLKEVYLENLKMLHPFIPFVTEEIWKVFNKESILKNQL